jgi:hypothetical protein
MYVLLTKSRPAVDIKWHQALKELAILMGETFELLMPPHEELLITQRRFLRSVGHSMPELYPHITDVARYTEIHSRFSELRASIEAHERNAIIRQLYHDRIDELIANIDMVLAANAHDDEGFQNANEYIYGRPDIHIFASACAWVRAEARKFGDERPEMRAACRAVLDHVPNMPGNPTLLFPEQETFMAVQKLHSEQGGYFDQLFAGVPVPDDMYVTRQNGDAFIRQVMANIGSDYTLRDAPAGLWAVLQSKREVIRPTDFVLSRAAFMGIVAHEVGSHLLEYTNGALGPLKLLELGLDRYELGNEGRAFLREQIIYPRFSDYVYQQLWHPTKASWEYRIAIHMAVSLAVGLHSRRYTFSEIYQLLAVLFEFWTMQRGTEKDDQIIQNGAWSMAVRVMKGTSGKGGAYHKDIVYLEGNIRCWQIAQKRPELIMFGDLGKFDIANQKHVMMLEELNILPK